MKKFKINIHFIMILIIILIAIVSVVKLLIWNKGSDSDFDPTAITTDFDTEPLDVIFQLTPDKLEGRTDDGQNTILLLGNNPISDLRDKNSSFAGILSNKTGATVYDGGFADTTLAPASSEYIEQVPFDAFTLYYLAEALATGDFSKQENGLLSGDVNTDDGSYEDTLDVLKGIDMETVDTLVIFYDANDMLNYRPIYTDEQNSTNNPVNTVCGSLSGAISQIQEAYPFIRIIVMSPFFSYARSEDGFYNSLDTADYGSGNLPNYIMHMINTAQEYDVSLIDNYYGTITEDNAGEYLSDNMHLNKEGVLLCVNRLCKVLGIGEE